MRGLLAVMLAMAIAIPASGASSAELVDPPDVQVIDGGNAPALDGGGLGDIGGCGTCDELVDAPGAQDLSPDAGGDENPADDADDADDHTDDQIDQPPASGFAPVFNDPSDTSLTLRDVLTAINADAYHRRGRTGSGVAVAIIDTGVVRTGGLDDGVLLGPDLSFESQVDQARHRDTFGHGTHLASILAGGSGVGPGRGVAPDATLVSLKVSGHDGAVDVSQVIAAVNWVTEHGPDLGIRVLNLSYGTDSLQDWQVDPLSHAVDRAWRSGIVVVAAGGNDGRTRDALRNPAFNPSLIAVGATDTRGTDAPHDDLLASFSNVGTAQRGPDLVAPGTGIIAQASVGSRLHVAHPASHRDGDMMRGSGTSQAAAVVSGAAALLLQSAPELSPDEVKAILTTSAHYLGTPGSGAGALQLPDPSQLDSPGGLARLLAAAEGHLQHHSPTTGLGSLHLARGTYVLSADGVTLEGEVDIMGQPWDPEAWAADTLLGRTWADGTWNGRAWTGTSWSAGMWTGRKWAGEDWSGRAWTGRAWSGRTWAGDSWIGRTWASTGDDWPTTA